MGFYGWLINVDFDLTFWRVVKMKFAFVVLCAFVCFSPISMLSISPLLLWFCIFVFAFCICVIDLLLLNALSKRVVNLTSMHVVLCWNCAFCV